MFTLVWQLWLWSEGDASSSNEAVHLQQRLRSLSTELVTLRNRLHVGQPAGAAGGAGSNNNNNNNNSSSGKPDKSPSSGAPAVPPRTSLAHTAGSSGHTLTASALVHQQQHGHGTAGPNGTALNGSSNHRMADLEPTKRHCSLPDDGMVSCVTALTTRSASSAVISDAKSSSKHQQQQGKTGSNGQQQQQIVGPVNSAALDDLIHLPGPLTEDAVLKCLQARFCAKHYHVNTNKDVVPDDLVAVFYKHTCNFGFATHLFGSELKALYASDTVPRGVSFRISPTSHTDL
ncbi:hypothetical protein TSAR_011880 [Trichomalopsis sarcophagae]|uniref:Uncharacterized protein n=1 Tax=Trichomalopsis sarcophagae TaxID=543379 RepID=A0A232FHJ9_9HYME|nr:hypothetical protein TSAR_011880 [Trichomalopsis sarcophagae]